MKSLLCFFKKLEAVETEEDEPESPKKKMKGFTKRTLPDYFDGVMEGAEEDVSSLCLIF